MYSHMPYSFHYFSPKNEPLKKRFIIAKSFISMIKEGYANVSSQLYLLH